MNDSFDDELRQSLHRRADQLPRRPDLSQGAIAQARGIRRRRRVAGAIAAVALVAIAVPVGIQVGDAMSDDQEPVTPPRPTPTGPVNVDLDLRDLPEGDPPSIPYLDGSTVVGDGYEIDISASGNPTGIAPVDDGVYVMSDWTEDGWPLTKYALDGGSDDLGAVQGTPVASTDGRWVAYVTSETDEFGNARGPASLVLRDQSGEESSVQLDGAEPSSVDVHAIVDGTAYFTYYLRSNGRDLPLQTWSSEDAAPEPVEGDLNATAVSRDGNLVARLTKVSDFDLCSTVVNLSTGHETTELCGGYLSIKGFSPDGRYAWADNAEGYGASEIVLLDTETGEVIRRYGSTKQGQVSFMDTTFEDDDSLLIRAEEDREATALLRCDVVTGECELAAPLADGSAEPPGRPPYLLPDIG